MKLNAVLLLSLAVSASACSKSSNLNTTQVGGTLAPTVETQASVEMKNHCALLEKVIAQPAAAKMKTGLDEIVTELTDEDTKALSETARVWRRATPSKLFTESQVTDTLASGVETANSIGVRMVLHGLVRNAPALKLHAGSFYAHVSAFPEPREGTTDKSTVRQSYLDIPAYGLTYGETYADSGLGVFSELFTDVEKTETTTTMIYSAAASKYGVRVQYKNKEGLYEVLKSEDCSMIPSVAAFTKLPRSQTTIQECEFGGCKNIPKD